MWTYILVVIFVILAIIIYFLTRKTNWAKAHSTQSVWLPEKLYSRYTTPRGSRVYSEKKPSNEFLELLDKGAQITFDNTVEFGWDKYRHHSEIEYILLPKTDLSKIGDCALIRTTGMNSITIAGAMIGVKLKGSGLDIQRPMVAMPFSEPTNEYCKNLVRDTARHETEHIVLLNNLTQFFYYQGLNDIHPIFGNPLLTQIQTTECIFEHNEVEWLK